jgi:lipopolysaccharide transport system permease protein
MSKPIPPVVIIRPQHGKLLLDWPGLVKYRDLLVLMVQRDFTSKYKQTILGPLWFFINPLVTTLVFTLVFNRIIGVSTDGMPPALFYFCGLMAWSYFSNVLAATSNSLSGNAHLFGKVYFPRIIPPLVGAISSMLALLIQFVTFLFYYAQHSFSGSQPTVVGPSLAWLYFPFIVLHIAILSLGVGLILSALTAKYRDLIQIQGFLVQIWMYGTPIIYPLSRIPEGWRWLAELNPMTPIVEASRLIFLGNGSVQLGSYAVSVALSVAILVIGLSLYQRTARTFIDTV